MRFSHGKCLNRVKLMTSDIQLLLSYEVGNRESEISKLMTSVICREESSAFLACFSSFYF